LHAIAPSLQGPWKEEKPAKLAIQGDHVAAPGVIFDEQEKMFHMFVQTEFLDLGGTVEHLISSDGKRFNNIGTVLESLPGTAEAGIYDPHPAIIHGEKYITYSGSNVFEHYEGYNIAKPDIFLAKSIGESWYGPWERLGKILSHNDVEHHNQLDFEDYEWGLEGSQVIELPNGKVLMNAVCFLPEGIRGTRQRVFFAIADSVTGPYKSLGPILDPAIDAGWGDAENGHAAAIIHDGKLELFYQARALNQSWKYGLASFDWKTLINPPLS
jgi:hypothetical protein